MVQKRKIFQKNKKILVKSLTNKKKYVITNITKN